MKNQKFNLSNFVHNQTEDLESPPRVCIPRDPFRIHPDKSRKASVFLTWKNERWYLVAKDVAEEFCLSSVRRAEIYEGVFLNGKTFLLPITLTNDPEYASWGDSLLESVPKARRHWVELEKDKDFNRHESRILKTMKETPNWSELEFEEIVALAFYDRIIDSSNVSQLLEKGNKRRQQDIEED